MVQTAPQELVAEDFMARKGYDGLKPAEVFRDGQFRWIFCYDLAEGELELLVEWLQATREWTATVQDFALTE